MMAVPNQIDPEVAEGLANYFASVGAGGLMGIPDLSRRREALLEMMNNVPREPNPSVDREDHIVEGMNGAPGIRVRVYRPNIRVGELPAVYFIHGGGMILGSVESDDALAEALTVGFGCVTASVDYRLAPESPFPAAVEDCYAGLMWIASNAEKLGVDAERIAIYGGSAGGGLAAATALLARDQGEPVLAFQMLLYPMLDDRCQTPSSNEITDIGVWDRSANIEAWRHVLGDQQGSKDVSPYAAPARELDLRGLPPTYIDVGALDLFRDEAIEYAARLMQNGVPTELHVYPGAVHSSEVFAPEADVSRRVVSYRSAALRRALDMTQ
jgi:acetyl esterase/lipase